MTSVVSRRNVIGSLAATSAMPLWPLFALAASTTSHSFKFGAFEISVVSDGHMTVPTRFLARNVSEREIKYWLGQSADMVTPATNVTLVRTPLDLILIDVGAGPHFMPTVGKLAENMETAGIDRKAVTKVVITHAHPDHLWGTLDDFDEEPNFPNASHVISAAEWNLWMSRDVLTKIPEDRQNFASGAVRNLRRIKDSIRTVTPGEDIVPGLRVVDTAGHTQGHIAVEVVSGSEAILVVGDALAHAVIAFAHPEWQPAADHDPERAAVTRRTLLSRLASDKTRLIGYHLPFPGIGFVETSGTAFRFAPVA